MIIWYTFSNNVLVLTWFICALHNWHSTISVLSLPSAFPILLKNSQTLDGVLDEYITNYKEYEVYHSAQLLEEY